MQKKTTTTATKQKANRMKRKILHETEVVDTRYIRIEMFKKEKKTRRGDKSLSLKKCNLFEVTMLPVAFTNFISRQKEDVGAKR